MDTRKDNVYNLYEYQFAKKVVKEAPEAIKALDKSLELCYNYRVYRDVFKVIEAINDAKIMLDLHLKNYEEVLKNKAIRSKDD